MSDNIDVTPGTGKTIAADDIGGGVLVQRVKTTWGPDGTANDADVASGKALPVQLRSSAGSDLLAGEYEIVAASQSAQVLGGSGAAGDYIAGILVIPATVDPGNVILLDNATSITVFTGGTGSVSNLVPFFIPLGMISVSGAWKISTGADVHCIAIGNFT
ncbi:hypothetical protein [Mesorhizobium sp. B2-4-6]|uniref:hypothetical protein n=1 Tax=Mesorhizobium sp. B2-4-6 TaxID=2589943 RepID=UPI00112BDAD6|nr:hypothetical protein [Mesorhizobium sp. B2-4-6]TPL40705.1 hypothetical protein FJ957_26095 [Mesorhizobium sp. B2-4-6]